MDFVAETFLRLVLFEIEPKMYLPNGSKSQKKLDGYFLTAVMVKKVKIVCFDATNSNVIFTQHMNINRYMKVEFFCPKLAVGVT